MKIKLTINAIILLLSAYGYSQGTIMETNQKMIGEIQNEFKSILSEISLNPVSLDSDKSVSIQSDRETVVPESNVDDTSIPNIFPIQGKPRISSPYGYRTSPFQNQKEFHGGIDFAVASNTDVLSTAAGKVIEVGYDKQGGRYLIVDHENSYRSYYGHLSSYLVKLGDSVHKGQVIAKSGKSGKVTGPHLHYSVYSGEKTINPNSIIH